MSCSKPIEPIELTEAEFRKISQLIYEQCGIYLNESKKELIKARLGKRLREGEFKSFRDYYDYILKDESGMELIRFLDSIATNFTFFFREPRHFEYLRFEFIPDMITRKRKSNRNRKIRLWSAGCSSGEEAYSIVITLLEAIDNPLIWDIKIIATDLSTRALKIAKSGIYPFEKVRDLDSIILRKYFLKGTKKWENCVRVKDQLKSYIRFQRLNLMERFPFSESFDCIFCRNVMIYFDKKHQTELVNRFYECLNSGGLLIVGHSESLSGISHPFKYLRPSIYKKLE
jgi:chemotaxis protein methyltransferase CheR